MSEHRHERAVPVWTAGDRLRKAREQAGFQQQELADLIDVSRRSVSSYESDVSQPRRPVLLSWAMATGVPMAWLKDGVEVPDGTPDGGHTTQPYVDIRPRLLHTA